MNPRRSMTYRPKRTLGGILLAASAAVMLAAAQPQETKSAPTPAPTSQPAAQTVWLRATSDHLNIRSRPDVNSTVVTQVDQNAILQAVGKQFGWYRILPPEGTVSLVSAAYIKRQSETRGTVAIQSGTLRVRVGSTIREVNPLQSEVQVRLEDGAEVQIVGTQGDWLKIVPPTGVRFYVSEEHVDEVSAEIAARLRPAVAPTTQPAGASGVPVAAATTQPAAPEEPAGPDLSGSWGQRLALVEAAIEVEGERPALEQEWPPLLTRLRPIAAQQTEPMVSRLAAAWIAQLETRIVDQDTLRMAEKLTEQSARERARQARELQRIEQLRKHPETQPHYDARGTLLRSYAVGERDGRHWYKLQDPLTREVVAYLEVTPENKAKLEPLAGHYVGVVGTRHHVESLGADVVRATRVVLLEGEAPTSQPARPKP